MPLPQGNAGIAGQYPNDAGIAADPSVLFFDDFDGYGSVASLRPTYDNTYGNLALDAVEVFAGQQSLRISMPNTSNPLYAALEKDIPPQDVLFVRFYTKLEAGFSFTQNSSAHNGIGIGAGYDLGPGVVPDGTNKFSVGLETSVYRNEAQPGYTHAYTYHMDQRSQYGDHFYSDGHVLPNPWEPGDFGPDFDPLPNHTPTRGVWYCVELMLQTNTPGLRDGRAAAWIDGVLIADWPNMRFRSTAALKIEMFKLTLGASSNTDGADSQWFDHVVVATSYIGPMSTGSPEPEEPTLMEIAALLAALETTLQNVETRLAALEARPTDPEIAARLAQVEADIVGLKGFDQSIKDL